MKSVKTILLSPLDWGLGHATRCIPVISHLLALGCKVVVATDGAPRQVLYHHFGDKLSYHHIPGYNIRYADKQVFLALVKQVPAIRKAIAIEKDWVKSHIETINPDGIISDNRYGFFHPQIPSVIITHQLQLQLPAPWSIMSSFVRLGLHRLLKPFSEIWVPDQKDAHDSLSGLLGHPATMPANTVRHIGYLSQMDGHLVAEKKYLVAAILSGPEPQRTIFEQMILDQAKNVKGAVVLVRGMPSQPFQEQRDNLDIIGFAEHAAIARLAAQSQYTISRSGYSTLMDLLPAGTKCLLVPTPGQTEQEYLAKRLQEKQIALTADQASFNLEAMISSAAAFPFHRIQSPAPNHIMQNYLTQWVDSLS